jgi:hypothetical protein
MPRRFGRIRFTLYEVVGLLVIAAISLAIGTSFLHDSLAVSLGIIGASLFNGVLCYLAGIGIGRLSASHLEDTSPPLLRFSIRDMLWLTMVVGVFVAWRLGNNNWERERALQQQRQREDQVEFSSMIRKLQLFEQSQTTRRWNLTHRSNLPSWVPLTDEQIQQIDASLVKFDWIYNPEAEQSESVPPHSPLTRFPVEWEDVILLIPDLSMNEMLAYKDYQRKKWLREKAQQQSK